MRARPLTPIGGGYAALGLMMTGANLNLF